MHDGEIIKQIRLLRKFSQDGAGKEIDISQQAFAKWEQKKSIPKKQRVALLKALNSSQKEFEVIKNLLYPPPRKNKLTGKIKAGVDR